MVSGELVDLYECRKLPYQNQSVVESALIQRFAMYRRMRRAITCENVASSSHRRSTERPAQLHLIFNDCYSGPTRVP